MLELRTLQAHDLDAVLAIQAACYEPFFHESADSFSAKIAASAQTCWLACRQDAPVGYLITLPVSDETFPALDASDFTLAGKPSLLYLHDLAVLPAARSLRLGQRFIDTALAAARRQNLPALGLIAVQGSAPYWEKSGFAVSDSMPSSVRSKLSSFGEDACYMARKS